MEASPRPWECPPRRAVRIPGVGGAALTFKATPSPAAIDSGLGATGIDISLMMPTYEATYRRRPVSTDFCDRLQQFLWTAASEFNPQELEPFEDQFADVTIRILASTDFTVTVEVEVIATHDEDDDLDEIDGLGFETTRAALITASEQAQHLADRDPDDTWWKTEPELPLDLLFRPERQRLTGIYRLPTWLHSRGTITVTHLVRYEDAAQGELETSFLTSQLAFATVAAHGVDDRHRPWAIVTQTLPEQSEASIASPWQPEIAAREEINQAVARMGGTTIVGESIATRDELIDLFEARGVDRSLVDDWTIYDLALAGIAELTNAPLTALAQGRLTGCAFPDIPHECPKDVWDCAFTRWQEMLFNSQGRTN